MIVQGQLSSASVPWMQARSDQSQRWHTPKRHSSSAQPWCYFVFSSPSNSQAKASNLRPKSNSVRQVSAKGEPSSIVQNCPACPDWVAVAGLQYSKTNTYPLSTAPAATCGLGIHQYVHPTARQHTPPPTQQGLCRWVYHTRRAAQLW